MTVFFSKKQKALMRKRKKKVLQNKVPVAAAALDDTPSSSTTTTTISLAVESKKRPLDQVIVSPADEPEGKRSKSGETDQLKTHVSGEGKIFVALPPNLSTKDAKKFRKDARRKLRTEYPDKNLETNVEFVEESHHMFVKKNKPKKSFPSIKDLLQQQKQEKEMEKLREEKKKKLDQVPDHIKSQYVALDCEMVGIGTDGKKSALARVSIVDWHGKALLDTFVQVPTRVTDFRTHVSGITPAKIKKSKNEDAMNEKECRELVAQILKGKILVGHALVNDLRALMLQHPKSMIRDTAKYRPFQRYGGNKWRPRKLRDLVKENLSDREGFQEASHDSVDDARATMELFQIVREQWEKDIAQHSK